LCKFDWNCQELNPGAPGVASSVQVAENTSDPVFRLEGTTVPWVIEVAPQ
jgi:hypothetical protein